uniref:Uncharacterized protein n=1 Tax=Alexandrium catenella TaxID=2925 RepID=A0A7S1LL73_ALECA
MGGCNSNTGSADYEAAPSSEVKNPNGPKVILIHGMASCALDSFVEPVECGCIRGDDFGCAMPCSYERGKWDQTWINVEEAVTGFARLVNVLKLEPQERKLKDGTVCTSMDCPRGVKVRPYEGVEGISQLNPKEAIPIPVWKGLTDELDRLGWNMTAVNYDWRRWGDRAMIEDYVAKFKARVEAEVGDGPAVPIIGHSMGCTVVAYCLSVLGTEWTKRYVSRTILVGMVLQGSPKVIGAFGHAPITFVANLPFSLPSAVENIVTSTMSTWPCLITTFPSKVGGTTLAFEEDYPFVICPTKKYTGLDMEGLLEEMGKKVERTQCGIQMWKEWANVSSRIKPPCVETHVIYGKGFETAAQLTFPDDDFQGLPKVTRHEDGDDTVTAASTEALCKAWQQDPLTDLTMHPLEVDHQNLIQGPLSVKLIPKLLTGEAQAIEAAK